MSGKHAVLEKTAPAQAAAEKKPAKAAKGGEPPCQGLSVSEEEIRKLAYQKWEAAGKPPGNGVNFWQEAERELCHTT
jgi:hypothetical protein